MTGRHAAVPGGPAGDTACMPAGWTVVPLGTVASTMDEARRLEGEGASDRTAVRADAQTGGHGRLGRSWASPPGNVYTTVILRPPIPTSRAAEASLVAAVAVADAVSCFAEPVGLKWPNDVLLDGGKVAGVLLEAVATGPSLSAVLVGIGINVASRPELPDRPTARIATADADTVFAALVEALGRRYDHWIEEGLDGVRRAWLDRGPALDTPITVGQGEQRLTGRFAGLEADGTLRLRLLDGTQHRIVSGEILA